ncbi:hypothetical protein [Curtobacterium herbarum]|uniref:Uncharacterized protein n=1 Tax=Curtobacterium herbarum TaxID=150122 RepID=A0ABP4K548_9MICO|nr:hypothetical protein [Curtobacterium herbarum]MBM7476975.1 hypothetical protein [Curtobacterium herbarum]MCS6545015.1 hypothetical protein [Curtobacterium herbarum]
MTSTRSALPGLTLTVALLASGLVGAAPAAAEPLDRPAALPPGEALPAISQHTLGRAIDEAYAAGAVTDDDIDESGRRTVTADLGDGLTIVLADGVPTERLAFGSDGRGAYIAFNSWDQNVILGGTGAILVTAICGLGPAACIIANTAVVLGASWLATHSKCPSPKSVRVYPVTKKPGRCV